MEDKGKKKQNKILKALQDVDKDKISNKNITRLITGMSQDTSELDQPKGTYRFALNATNESDVGHSNFTSNAEGSIVAGTLPNGYIPMGKCYMTNGEYALFLVEPGTGNSQIGIYKDGEYTAHVSAYLGFSATDQIDCTYRRRRGCERTIYFLGGNGKPMIYNFEKPDSFKTNGDWDINKFGLFKTYSSVPTIDNISVTEEGQLPPGSYILGIQLIDGDFNPTEVITLSNPVIIYNDIIEGNSFSDIEGSTGLRNSYTQYNNTNKAITIEVGNLDPSYLFYRVVVIEANNGSGQISRVLYSDEISTGINKYTYTGGNSYVEGTIEEVQTFKDIIDSAEHIEQIENRLILSNTKGKQVNFCGLQRYASKIKAELTFKTINLTDIHSEGNSKRPTFYNEAVGYMPGEIYSFGIVYMFKDGTVSPVYHIPGKSEGSDSMMSSDNELVNTRYIDNSQSCKAEDYWGFDAQKNKLENKPVRHHRFPLRGDLNKPLFRAAPNVRRVTRYRLSYTSNTLVSEVDPSSLPGGVVPSSLPIIINYRIHNIDENGDVTYEKRNVESVLYIPTDGTVLINTIITEDERPISYDPDIGEFGIQEKYSNGLFDPSKSTGVVYDPIYSEAETNLNLGSHKESEVFGITFNDIELPPSEVTNGEEIIGYYIVRNERTENDKTILDTGVMFPLVKEERSGVNRFTASGFLMPNTSKIQKDIVGLLHPEHLFNSNEYFPTEFIQEGEFVADTRQLLRADADDVQPGTSYDPERHKKRERDNDGFDLHVIVRQYNLEYGIKKELNLKGPSIKENFYLNALHGHDTIDLSGKRREVYNLSTDNKIGIVQADKEIMKSNIKDFNADSENFKSKPNVSSLPYVVMKRNLLDPYGDYRVRRYLREHPNVVLFEERKNSSKEVFNGDSFITPMRAISTSYHSTDIVMRDEKNAKKYLKIAVGVLAIAAGIAFSVVTLGAGSPIGAFIAAGGVGAIAAVTGGVIAAVAFGVSQLQAGIDIATVQKVFLELYEEGLEDTVDDHDTSGKPGAGSSLSTRNATDYPPNFALGTSGRGGDDEIRWFMDSLNSLWFESSVNMNLRHGITSTGITDFLPPLQNSSEVLQAYAIDKLTTVSLDNADGRSYQGLANAQFHEINKDYSLRADGKWHYHLALEYDCCSPCLEEFPLRSHYSEQTFQEELTDNFRSFLANNYRDLEGETGKITNIFRIQNNVFIHTEEGLWMQPQNIQERITGDVTSFIGTGEFFSIPARKIVDDETGNSAGSKHKWGTIKTPHGVFFISETQSMVYQFNGQNLVPISSRGMFNWFKNNIENQTEKVYKDETGLEYPFKNNPSNPFGTGFITVYDSRKEKIFITKKDKTITYLGVSHDHTIDLLGNSIYIFDNFTSTIEAQTSPEAAIPKVYRGIVNGELLFEHIVEQQQSVDTTTAVPNTTDIHFIVSASGGYLGLEHDTCVRDLTTAIENWKVNNVDNNNLRTGEVFIHYTTSYRWLKSSDFAYNAYGSPSYIDPIKAANPLLTDDQATAQVAATKDVLIVPLQVVNSNYGSLSESLDTDDDTITPPNINFETDAISYIYTDSLRFNSINSFMYPIVKDINSMNCAGNFFTDPQFASKNFYLHTIAAFFGTEVTFEQLEEFFPIRNEKILPEEWEAFKLALRTENPYDDFIIQSGTPGFFPIPDLYFDGLYNHGWTANWNTFVSDDGFILDAAQIESDLMSLLPTTQSTTTRSISVGTVVKTVFPLTIAGQSVEVDNGWTMSYCLKNNSWISFHSFLPNFYMGGPDEMYSIIYGDTNVWKHNAKTIFNTYYGITKPFIIEYVSVSSPIVTRVWDSIKLLTEATKWDEVTQSFKNDQFTTFNKGWFYNNSQSTGELAFINKEAQVDQTDFFDMDSDDPTKIILDKSERDWNINNLRDIVINYSDPLFNEKKSELQEDYFIDKKINLETLNPYKDWSDLQSLRGKYLTIRLIFDTFTDVKLILNYSIEDEKGSQK